MEQATIATVKEYAHELMDYIDNCYSFVDVVARTMLWRGRIRVTLQKPKCFRWYVVAKLQFLVQFFSWLTNHIATIFPIVLLVKPPLIYGFRTDLHLFFSVRCMPSTTHISYQPFSSISLQQSC